LNKEKNEAYLIGDRELITEANV